MRFATVKWDSVVVRVLRLGLCGLMIGIVIGELGLHVSDYAIPLQHGYMLVCDAGVMSGCALTYNTKRIGEGIVEYAFVPPSAVVGVRVDGRFVLADGGNATVLEGERECRAALRKLGYVECPELERVSRCSDPQYWQIQILILGIAGGSMGVWFLLRCFRGRAGSRLWGGHGSPRPDGVPADGGGF